MWWGVRRTRAGRSTLIAFDLFRVPSFRNGNIVALVVSLGEFGIILALPLWLQFVLGLSALQTGLILLALAIGSFVASGFAGAMSGRLAPVTIVRAGLVAEIVGVAAIGLVIAPDTSWALLLPFLFIYGLGVGLATAQLTGVVLADVPVAEGGQASGTQSTSRQLGAALGIAILGTILFAGTATVLDAKLDDRGIPADQRDQVVSAVVDSAGGAIAGLEASPQTQAIADDAKAALSAGTKYAAFAAAGFLAVGLLSTISLGRGRRPAEVQRSAIRRGAGTARLTGPQRSGRSAGAAVIPRHRPPARACWGDGTSRTRHPDRPRPVRRHVVGRAHRRGERGRRPRLVRPLRLQRRAHRRDRGAAARRDRPAVRAQPVGADRR